MNVLNVGGAFAPGWARFGVLRQECPDPFQTSHQPQPVPPCVPSGVRGPGPTAIANAMAPMCPLCRVWADRSWKYDRGRVVELGCPGQQHIRMRIDLQRPLASISASLGIQPRRSAPCAAAATNENCDRHSRQSETYHENSVASKNHGAPIRLRNPTHTFGHVRGGLKYGYDSAMCNQSKGDTTMSSKARSLKQPPWLCFSRWLLPVAAAKDV